MVWGAFSGLGRSALVVVGVGPGADGGGGVLKGVLECLEGTVPPLMGEKFTFMHDNPPIHKWCIIRNWVMERSIRSWHGLLPLPTSIPLSISR